MRRLACLIALACPATAVAQAPEPPRLVVSGEGVVSTPPDRATLSFTVRGEGATSDDAVRAMVARRDAIAARLAALDAQGFAVRTGEPRIMEVRSRACDADGDDKPRLSTGDCAIQGYVAELPAIIRTHTIAKAGTAVGLIGRIGGLRPHIDGYALADAAASRSRALAAAIADARARADATARAAGARLGPLVRLVEVGQDETMADIVVTGERTVPAPLVTPPPVTIALNPDPIETRARVTVTYAILL